MGSEKKTETNGSSSKSKLKQESATNEIKPGNERSGVFVPSREMVTSKMKSRITSQHDCGYKKKRRVESEEMVRGQGMLVI